MKKIIFHGEEFESEKIFKKEDSIIGLDEEGMEIFGFYGISNFESFELVDCEFDYNDYDELEKIKSDLLYLSLMLGVEL